MIRTFVMWFKCLFGRHEYTDWCRKHCRNCGKIDPADYWS